MGVIRGGLLVVVSVLLFVSIFAGLIFFTMSWSLNYDNVQVELKEVINDTFRSEVGIESIVDRNYLEMIAFCQNSSYYVFGFEERTLTLPCSVVLQGQDFIFEKSVELFIEDVYFSQYDCSFWNCFSQEKIPFFLVSAKAQSYWYSKFNYVLIIFGLLCVLGFLLSEKKSNFFLLLSVLLIIASIPFSKFDLFAGFFGDKAEGLLNVFFSKAYAVFLRGVIIGAILIFVGILLKFFRIGFKIQSIFSKVSESSGKVQEDKDEKLKIKKIVKRKIKEKKKRR